MSASTFNWAPLESDPMIFNDYFKKIGLPENFNFNELYTIDYKEVQPIEGQVLSVIINFEKINENPYLRNPLNYVDYNTVPFYMKQTGELDYACGLIAAMHGIGNNLANIPLVPDSILSNFFENSKVLTPEQRAELLCNNNQMKNAHDQHAQMGQSHAEHPSDVKNHFNSFNLVNGKIYEFDGTQQGVYLIKENVTNESFFDETLAEISSRLTNQNITESLSILFLTQN